MATVRSRPCVQTFVMRNTERRRPTSARPHTPLALAVWYSHATRLDRLAHDADGLGRSLRLPKVVPAETHDRDFVRVGAERSPGNAGTLASGW